jgi:S-(hydroxymethyl)glutathione dehydrogenase/alcohol dehydrogenase
MLAAVLHQSPGSLSVEEVVVDDPGPHEVLVRTAATGLCHSDLNFMEGDGFVLEGPTVFGHEGAGVVEAVGSAVRYVQPGDHVIAFVHGFCGSCNYCLSGRPHLCAMTGLSRGPGEPPRLRLAESGNACLQFCGLGTFAEKMLVHENHLCKIPPGIPLDRAALVGCGVPTGVGAVTRVAKVPAGATTAVVGCGGIGLNVIQGCLLAGARRIIAVDVSDGKLETARKFGATDLINSSSGDVLERVNRLLPGEGGVDYAFEAVGLKATFELAFALVRRGGTAVMIGLGNSAATWEISPRDLLRRSILGCAAGGVWFRQDLPYLLELYQAGRLKLDELVSNRISLADINSGYAAIHSGDVARSVIVFDH